MPLFCGVRSLAVPLIVAWITCATLTSGQLLANTPGGLRPIANSDSSSTVTRCLNGTDCTVLQQSSSRDGSSSSKVHELVALGLDTLGEVLYQNHPLALEQISAAEADAMVAKYTAAAAARPNTVDSSSPDNQGSSPSSSSSSSSSSIHTGITDALAVLLGQASAAPAAAVVPSTAAAPGSVNAAKVEAPTGLPGAVAELLKAEIGAAAPYAAAATSSSSSSSSSSSTAGASAVQPPIIIPGSSSGSSDQTGQNATTNQDVIGSETTMPDQHQPDSFAFGKGNVTQVVISSLKMSPVTVEQLAKIAGPGASAVAWQDGLQATLSNATANATGMPVQQIQTKISSVLNLVS
jgi:hypothetical protein